MGEIQVGAVVRWVEHTGREYRRRIIDPERFRDLTEEAIQRAIREAQAEAEAYPLREPSAPKIGRAKHRDQAHQDTGGLITEDYYGNHTLLYRPARDRGRSFGALSGRSGLHR